MNSLFGLIIKISISSRMLCAIATATAVFTAALPVPVRPQLLISMQQHRRREISGSQGNIDDDNDHHHDVGESSTMTMSTATMMTNDKEKLIRLKKRLDEKIMDNAKHYGITLEQINNAILEEIGHENNEESGDEEDQTSANNNEGEMDFTIGNKDTCVLEIDDAEDADILNSLLDPLPPKDFYIYSTEEPIGIPTDRTISCCQTFSQVWRGKISPSSKDLNNACQNLMSLVAYKLRSFRPCIIIKLNFQADVDDENELQLIISGTAISLNNNVTAPSSRRNTNSTNQFKTNNIEQDLLFNMDSVKSDVNNAAKILNNNLITNKPLKFYAASKEGHGINITSLSYIPGAKIEKYFGNLNFFLIRETSSLKENGGLNSFIQSFINEVYAIVRSHVLALGANGLVGFFMSEFVMTHSLHKNQAQCLIHVGGDVIQANYTTTTS